MVIKYYLYKLNKMDTEILIPTEEELEQNQVESIPRYIV